MERPYADTPSNRLYHGVITTFHAACRAMIQQYQQERHWIATKYRSVDQDDAERGLAEMDGYIAAVNACRHEYQEALDTMEKTLAARWESQEGEIPQMLAEALRSGDYSRLAL
jgi:DNA-binding transcriptional MocR family regulator